MLEFLLDHHVSTELTDTDLWQPLHAAACWGHLEAVEILAQNGADISAVTRSGETPFDITEDPDIKDRLVELAEQRLRMAAEPGRGTGVRRGRSSAGSTRTHSIRRTSLRDKMKTTKKDVAEEGLIYMKSVTQSPSPPVNDAAALDSTHNSIINNNNNNNNNSHHKEELLGAAGATTSFSAMTSLPSSPSSGFTNSSGQNGGGGSTDVVDVADVQISLAGSFPPTPSLAPPIKSTPAGSAANLKPVQHVAPTIKAKAPVTTTANNGPSVGAAKTSPPPPVRPARLMDRRQSSVEESMVSGGTAGMPAAAAASVWTSSPNVTNSGGSSGGGGEPINIHVSVTINPPLIGKKNSTLFFKLNFENIVMDGEISTWYRYRIYDTLVVRLVAMTVFGFQSRQIPSNLKKKMANTVLPAEVDEIPPRGFSV